MASPLVSVVIPSYNYARYMRLAIESVIAQTYPEIEILVVDDGSKDDSVAVAGSFGERVRIFQQKNSGPAMARNRGISESRGEYLAFLDADDLWTPDKIARQVERMSDPRVGLVNVGMEYIDADGKSLGVNLEGVEGQILEQHALLRRRTVGPPSAVLVRRSALDQVGVFDPKLAMSADWDMWRRVGSSFDVAMVRAPLLKYRVHGSALHHNVELLEKDMLYAFEQMFSDPRSAAIQARRRECYANLYVMLCGSYLHRKRWSKGLGYALRSLQQRPDRLVLHTLAVPVRKARRLVFGADPA